jgi:hypothetical protein
LLFEGESNIQTSLRFIYKSATVGIKLATSGRKSGLWKQPSTFEQEL